MLSTYSENVGPTETKGKRTYFSVVPKNAFFGTCLAFHSYNTSPSSIRKRRKSKAGAKKLAVKLHTYSHLHAEDMKKLCERAGFFSKILDEELKLAVERCGSCKGTERPLQNRSIAARKVLST